MALTIIDNSNNETNKRRFHLSFSIFLFRAAKSRGCSSLSGDVTSLNIVTASGANSQLKCDQNALSHLYMCAVEVEEAQQGSGLTAGKRKFRGMTQARIADINQTCAAEPSVWPWLHVDANVNDCECGTFCSRQMSLVKSTGRVTG